MKKKILIGLVVTALLLTISGTTSAFTFNRPYDGAIIWDIQNWDMGTTYGLGVPTGYAGPIGGYPGPVWPAINTWPGEGEDGWGVFRINSFQPAIAGAPGSNTINVIPGSELLWQENTTAGTELVGIFYGLDDIAIDDSGPGASQTILSDGIAATGGSLMMKVWEQPFGAWDAAVTAATGGAVTVGPWMGSAGRFGPDAYVGVGLPGGVAGATHIATFLGVPGFVDPLGGPPTVPPGFPNAEFESNFDATVGTGGDAGGATLFVEIVDGPFASGYPNIDSDFFVSSIPGVFADVRIELSTELNNPLNTPFYNPLGIGDWTVSSNDESEAIWIIPEPTTMLGMFLGLGGLSGYIRRRFV